MLPKIEGTLTIRDMFVYSKKPNNLFGITGYDIPKKYLDPLKQMKEREYLTQKKGVRSKKTKIPNKYFEGKPKATPAPNSYNIVKPWVDVKEKRAKSVLSKARNVSKNTYIDKIFTEAKRVKTPGPGSYNPYQEKDNKTERPSIKLKSNKDEKPNFLQESEFVGAMFPGPGAYNPHDWISKDASLTKGKLKSAYPDQGSYNPIPVHIDTFAKIFKENEGKPKNPRAKSNYFGRTERFCGVKTNKSKSFSIPGPGFYNVLYEWPGKKEKKEEKKTNLSSIISKGLDKSIYYD